MKQSKITFLTSLGAGLEYYDFVIYTLLASFISQQFFPTSNHTAALFAVFGVFAVGNIIRPLGGIIFGIFGDRHGRKNVFANTLLWMALATFLMGITPTFATIGLAATIIFSLCRILQGITCGAEIPGAATFLAEHIDTKHHGKHFGFAFSAVGLGVTFGSFIIWILTKTLTNTQMSSWGFRIPFLLGGSLALIGFLIRKHVPETPAFLAFKTSQNKKTHLHQKQHLQQIIITIGILLFPACLINFMLALPALLHNNYNYSFSDIYLAMTVGYLWSAILLPIFGWLSDHIGRKTMLIIAPLLFIIVGFPIFSTLHSQTRLALFGFIMLIETMIPAMASCYFVLLPRTLPTAIRYTGTALSYNITYTIAALIPLIANFFFGVLHHPSYLIAAFIILALITVISTTLIKTHSIDGSASE